MKLRGRSNSTKTKRKRKIDDAKRLWSEIPDDILCLVTAKINFIDDFVRFCAVCRSWYTFGTDHYSRLKKLDFAPLFMLREELNSSTTKRTFRNYVSGNDFVLDLPEASGRRCWGSPFGWIVTFGAADLEFSLLNPFSRATIALPSLRTLLPAAVCYNPNERFIKAILTASPDSLDCVVVLIILPIEDCSMLGFARPGDEVWSRIEGCPCDLNDVVQFQGSLYGCRRSSPELVSIQPPIAVEFAVLPLDMARDLRDDDVDLFMERYQFESIKYVVNLGGDLCLVLRYITRGNRTYHFKVFKIDMNTKKWTRVWPSMGDQCLFLGNHYSFAYTCDEAMPSASDNHFKANFIYYTNDDDLSRNGLDEGFRNSLSCRKAQRNYEDFVLNPSLWITPRLHFSCLHKSLSPKKMHELLALLG